MQSKNTTKPRSCNAQLFIGDVFGFLTVKGIALPDKNGRPRWEYLCGCGKTAIASANSIKQGKTTSCGCRHGNTIHGLTGSPEHRAWAGIKRRCFDSTNPAFLYYGGRGITMFAPWINDFMAFYSHVGERPSPQHSLDRYPNNDGNYEPGNVRWATRTEQARNTRRNARLTFQGKTMCKTEWALHVGIPLATLTTRLRRGWSTARALATPSRSYTTYSFH